MLFTIGAENLDLFRKRFARMSRAYIKLGMPAPEYRIVDEKILANEEDFFRQGQNVVDVEISVELPMSERFKFVGCVEPVPGSDENLVYSYGGETLPEKYRKCEANCDHCRQDRKRERVYILRDMESGKYSQVGKSCLAGYLPGGISVAMLKALDVLPGMGWEDQNFFGRSPEGASIDLARFLPFVSRSIRQDGWVSRSEAQRSYPLRMSTADRAYEDYREARERQTFWTEGLFEKMFSPEDFSAARRTLEYFTRECPEECEEYERNLFVVFGSGRARIKDLPLAASAIQHVSRKLAKESSQRMGWADAHAGKPGERLDLGEVTVEKVFSFEGMYGMSHLHVFRDSEDRALVWKTGAVCMMEGEKLHLTGTVKEHGEYDGRQQTVLSRCKYEMIFDEADEDSPKM